MAIQGGIEITAEVNAKSRAYSDKKYFFHPKNTGKLVTNGGTLCFAGEKRDTFYLTEIEVWGLNSFQDEIK